jgi:hypothetical protein
MTPCYTCSTSSACHIRHDGGGRTLHLCDTCATTFDTGARWAMYSLKLGIVDAFLGNSRKKVLDNIRL